MAGEGPADPDNCRERTGVHYCLLSSGKLGKLKELDLTETGLKKLPKAAAKLQELEKLFLSQNRLESLPAEIQALARLKELWIGHNPCSDSEEKQAAIRERVGEWLPGCEVKFELVEEED